MLDYSHSGRLHDSNKVACEFRVSSSRVCLGLESIGFPPASGERHSSDRSIHLLIYLGVHGIILAQRNRNVLLVLSSRALSASEMNHQSVVSTVRARTIQIGVVAGEIVIIRICIALHVQFFTIYPCRQDLSVFLT